MEEFVSFETAKLLKEKGFDIECRTYFDEKKFKKRPVEFFGKLNANTLTVWSHELKKNVPANLISCPTQTVAQKWLREKFNLHINPRPYVEFIDGEITGYFVGSIFISNIENDLFYDDNYSTYEEALEKGLYEALKLL